MSELAKGEFELVFEGPADDSAETLRRLKGAFIADLELTIGEVQEILKNYPLTIKRAESSSDLQLYAKSLKNAGGKVTIVQKSMQEDFDLNVEPSADDEEAETTWIKQGAERGHATEEPEEQESSSEMEFEFEIETQPAAVKIRPREYTLSLDDADSIIPEYLLKQQPEKQDPKAPEEPLFSLASGQEAKLKDSPPENTPAETEDFLGPAEDLGLSLELDPENSSEQSALPEEIEPVPAPMPESPGEQETYFRIQEEGDPSRPVDEPSPVQEAATSGQSAPGQELAAFTSASPGPGQISKPPSSLNTPLAELQKKTRSSKPATQARPDSPGLKAQQGASEGAADPPPAPPRLRRRKSTLRKVIDTLFPLSIGIGILCLGNWYYFSHNGVDIDPAVMDKIIKMVTAQDSAASARESDSRKASKQSSNSEQLSPALRGQNSEQGLTVSWELPLKEDRPSGLSLSLGTPRPARLTPEEIVANRIQAPWLKKITVESRTLPQNAEGEFLVKGSAKIYVDQNNTGFRFLSQAVVRGRIDPATRRVSGNVEVKLGLESSPDGKPYYIEETGAGKYRFYVTARFGDQISAAPAS